MNNEYNREDVRRERKKGLRAYLIMVVAVVACAFLWRDASIKDERLEAAREIIRSDQKTKSTYEMQAHNMATLLRKEQQAAGKFEVSSLNKEQQIEALAHKIGVLERKVSVEQGKRGPMQRKINEQQEHICNLEQMLRDKKVRLYMKPECRPGT